MAAARNSPAGALAQACLVAVLILNLAFNGSANKDYSRTSVAAARGRIHQPFASRKALEASSLPTPQLHAASWAPVKASTSDPSTSDSSLADSCKGCSSPRIGSGRQQQSWADLPPWTRALEQFDPLAPCHFPALARHREKTLSIEDFGGVGDGLTSNTAAFRSAIRAISESGGRVTLVVPRGRWVTGPFNLTSHMTLLLKGGCSILASEDFNEYPLLPQPPSYGPGREYAGGPRRHSLIMAYKVTDVIITGANGTIDGQGPVWWEAHERHKLQHMRPHLLEIQHSDHVSVLNTTFVDSPIWNIRALYSSCLIFKGLTITAPTDARQTDGIDPDSSSNILIEDTYISTGDDAIAIKSGWDHHGYALGIPSTDILVRRVSVWAPRSCGISIGSEMSGGVERVVFEDCHVADTMTAFRIKSGAGRGGYVKEVLIRDSIVTNVGIPFVIDTYFGHGNAPGFDPKALPIIQDIAVKNLTGLAARVVQVKGLKDSPIANLHLSEVDITLLEKRFARRAWNCFAVNGTVARSYIPGRMSKCSSLAVVQPAVRQPGKTVTF